MATIRSDNPETKDVLTRIRKLISKNGGALNPGIEIISSDGYLSVNSKLERGNHDQLIYVSPACLPFVDDFELSLDGDLIRGKPLVQNSPSRLHIKTMNLMIELYNLTGKIKEHRDSIPAIALINSPLLLDHLYKGGQYQPENNNFQGTDQEIVKSFMNSRVSDFVEDGKIKGVVMPIIDLFNHHQGAFYYNKKNDVDYSGISVFNSKPLMDSDECFVRYNHDCDALGLFIIYGFVDSTTTIVRSVPISIELGNIGCIKINRIATPVIPPESLPPGARDLNKYFPHINQINKSTIEISSLIIPSYNGLDSLRRILAILIKILAPNMPGADLNKIIFNTENSILKANAAYYSELQELATNSLNAGHISPRVAETLTLLAETQLSKLSDYRMRMTSRP